MNLSLKFKSNKVIHIADTINFEYSQAMTCAMSPQSACTVTAHCCRVQCPAAVLQCCSVAVLRDSPLCLLLLAAAYKLYLIVIIFLLHLDKS